MAPLSDSSGKCRIISWVYSPCPVCACGETWGHIDGPIIRAVGEAVVPGQSSTTLPDRDCPPS